MTHPRVIVTASLALLLGGAPALTAGFGPGAGVSQPTLLRLTVFVGTAPPGERTLGPITLGIDHTVATFEIAAVQTVGGSLTEGRAALRHVELYRPNLLLVGDLALLRSISEAPPHTKLTVFGYFSGNSRRLIVVQVDTP